MYNYILGEGNKVIINDEENQVGELFVSIKDGKAYMEIIEMPNAKDTSFGGYFSLLTEIKENIKKLLNVKEVVCTGIKPVREFDEYANNMCNTLNHPIVSRK